MKRYIKPSIEDIKFVFADSVAQTPGIGDGSMNPDDQLGKQRGEDFSDEAAEKGKGWSEGLW